MARNQHQNFSINNFGLGEKTGVTETYEKLQTTATLRQAEDHERARYIKEQQELFEKENAAYFEEEDQEAQPLPQPEALPWRPKLVPIDDRMSDVRIEQLNSSYKKKRSE